MATPVATPMQQAIAACRAANPGALALYRAGDFYELLGDDAVTAARVLGLTLTQRTKGEPMAGFPVHSAERYVAQLADAGHAVAYANGGRRHG